MGSECWLWWCLCAECGGDAVMCGAEGCFCMVCFGQLSFLAVLFGGECRVILESGFGAVLRCLGARIGLLV